MRPTALLWEDREVCVKFVTANEAAKLPLRKEPAREGELRIIDIKDYDLSACGGTHVRRTGAIGVIAISGVERFKGGLRVEFVCGGRALRTYRSLKSAVGGSVRLLSVLPDELPSAIEKLQTRRPHAAEVPGGLYDRLAAHEAASLAAAAEKIGGVNVVAASVSGWDANGLKKLASSIAAKPATVALLITTESPTLVVAARSQDLSLDTGAVLKNLIEQFGGRGGGKGAMAQGRRPCRRLRARFWTPPALRLRNSCKGTLPVYRPRNESLRITQRNLPSDRHTAPRRMNVPTMEARGAPTWRRPVSGRRPAYVRNAHRRHGRARRRGSVLERNLRHPGDR